MKTCLICGKELPLTDFYKCNHGVGGVHSYCKTCHLEKTKAWRKENPDAFAIANRAAAKRYYQNHREKINTWYRGYYAETLESRRDNVMLKYFEYLETIEVTN